MKELADLFQDTENYIAWINRTVSPPAEENARRLLAGVLDYDPDEEIVPVKITGSPPAPTDPEVKFVLVSGQPPITGESLECAGRITLGYGSNLFLYTAGPYIKVVNVEVEDRELVQEVMVEFNFLQDDPTEISTTLWPLCKKDCGKKVLVVTLKNTSP